MSAVRVLVVDDDFLVRRIHTGFVARVDGFEVVGTAGTGAETREQVAALSPDLLLLDLYLPDAFGLDLLSTLRGDGHRCDAIVISAAREVEAVRAAARLGVADYVLKPFSFTELRERLERYAERRRVHEAAEVRGQEDVDRLFARAGAAGVRAPLPKGMSPETAALVTEVLRTESEPLSATETAERLGLSRVSARRYLEHFVTTGQADVRLRYGSSGRPERLYRWTG